MKTSASTSSDDVMLKHLCCPAIDTRKISKFMDMDETTRKKTWKRMYTKMYMKVREMENDGENEKEKKNARGRRTSPPAKLARSLELDGRTGVSANYGSYGSHRDRDSVDESRNAIPNHHIVLESATMMDITNVNAWETVNGQADEADIECVFHVATSTAKPSTSSRHQRGEMPGTLSSPKMASLKGLQLTPRGPARMVHEVRDSAAQTSRAASQDQRDAAEAPKSSPNVGGKETRKSKLLAKYRHQAEQANKEKDDSEEDHDEEDEDETALDGNIEGHGYSSMASSEYEDDSTISTKSTRSFRSRFSFGSNQARADPRRLFLRSMQKVSARERIMPNDSDHANSTIFSEAPTCVDSTTSSDNGDDTDEVNAIMSERTASIAPSKTSANASNISLGDSNAATKNHATTTSVNSTSKSAQSLKMIKKSKSSASEATCKTSDLTSASHADDGDDTMDTTKSEKSSKSNKSTDTLSSKSKASARLSRSSTDDPIGAQTAAALKSGDDEIAASKQVSAKRANGSDTSIHSAKSTTSTTRTTAKSNETSDTMQVRRAPIVEDVSSAESGASGEQADIKPVVSDSSIISMVVEAIGLGPHAVANATTHKPAPSNTSTPPVDSMQSNRDGESAASEGSARSVHSAQGSNKSTTAATAAKLSQVLMNTTSTDNGTSADARNDNGNDPENDGGENANRNAVPVTSTPRSRPSTRDDGGSDSSRSIVSSLHAKNEIVALFEDLDDVDAASNDSFDPWIAAKLGNLEALEKFHKAEGNDWTKEDDFGNIPLYYACHSGAAIDLKTVLFLVDVTPKVADDVLERCRKNAINQNVVRLLNGDKDFADEINKRVGEVMDEDSVASSVLGGLINMFGQEEESKWDESSQATEAVLDLIIQMQHKEEEKQMVSKQVAVKQHQRRNSTTKFASADDDDCCSGDERKSEGSSCDGAASSLSSSSRRSRPDSTTRSTREQKPAQEQQGDDQSISGSTQSSSVRRGKQKKPRNFLSKYLGGRSVGSKGSSSTKQTKNGSSNSISSNSSKKTNTKAISTGSISSRGSKTSGEQGRRSSSASVGSTKSGKSWISRRSERTTNSTTKSTNSKQERAGTRSVNQPPDATKFLSSATAKVHAEDKDEDEGKSSVTTIRTTTTDMSIGEDSARSISASTLSGSVSVSLPDCPSASAPTSKSKTSESGSTAASTSVPQPDCPSVSASTSKTSGSGSTSASMATPKASAKARTATQQTVTVAQATTSVNEKRGNSSASPRPAITENFAEFTKQGNRCIISKQTKKSVEKHYGSNMLTFDCTTPALKLLITDCHGVTITVKGKCNSIVVENCSKFNLVFDTVISTCEIVNSNKIGAQTNGICPTFSIDTSTGVLCWLSAESVEVTTFVTSMSTEMSASLPVGPAGDRKEVPIPEQFVHRLEHNGSSISSSASSLYG